VRQGMHIIIADTSICPQKQILTKERILYANFNNIIAVLFV
jgi:hypothetical protein